MGGESDPNATRDGPTTNAVRQAIANGVYVVAAAGNDGGSEDDGRVATPSNVNEAISVAAIDEAGEIWEGSSLGESKIVTVNQDKIRIKSLRFQRLVCR